MAERIGILGVAATTAAVLLIPMALRWEVVGRESSRFNRDLTGGLLYLSDIPVLLSVGLLALWLLRPGSRLEVGPRGIVLPLLALAALASLSIGWAPSRGVAADAALHTLVLLGLYAALVTFGPTGPLAATALVVGAAGQGALAIAQSFAQHPLGLDALGEVPFLFGSEAGCTRLRAGGLSPNPNILGGYLAVGILAGLGVPAASRWARLGIGLALALALGGLLATASRAALVGLVAGLLVLLRGGPHPLAPSPSADGEGVPKAGVSLLRPEGEAHVPDYSGDAHGSAAQPARLLDRTCVVARGGPAFEPQRRGDAEVLLVPLRLRASAVQTDPGPRVSPVLDRSRAWWLSRQWVAAGLALAAIAAFAMSPTFGGCVGQRLAAPVVRAAGFEQAATGGGGADVTGGRLELARAAAVLAAERPLLGVGHGNFAIAWLVRGDPKPSNGIYQPVHNVPALVTAELGIAGGLAWGGLWLGVGLAAWRRRRSLDRWQAAWLSALAAIFTVGLLDFYPWGWQQGRLLFAVILGLWARSMIGSRPDRQQGLRGGTGPFLPQMRRGAEVLWVSLRLCVSAVRIRVGGGGDRQEGHRNG